MLTVLPKVLLSASVLNSQIGQSTTLQAGLSRVTARLSRQTKDTTKLSCLAMPKRGDYFYSHRAVKVSTLLPILSPIISALPVTSSRTSALVYQRNWLTVGNGVVGIVTRHNISGTGESVLVVNFYSTPMTIRKTYITQTVKVTTLMLILPPMISNLPVTSSWTLCFSLSKELTTRRLAMEWLELLPGTTSVELALA